MARTTDAREKALGTAERLFRTQGYAATGLAQIIAESGSPKGSFYFHFPGGKDQLAAETIAAFGARGLAGIRRAAEATAGDAAGFIEALCAATAAEMRASDHQLGCVLQNIAAERAPDDPVLTPLLGHWFDAWAAAVTDHFAACGVPKPQAMALALLAALEGARTLARATRSETAFQATAATMKAALEGRP